MPFFLTAWLRRSFVLFCISSHFPAGRERERRRDDSGSASIALLLSVCFVFGPCDSGCGSQTRCLPVCVRECLHRWFASGASDLVSDWFPGFAGLGMVLSSSATAHLFYVVRSCLPGSAAHCAREPHAAPNIYQPRRLMYASQAASAEGERVVCLDVGRRMSESSRLSVVWHATLPHGRSTLRNGCSRVEEAVVSPAELVAAHWFIGNVVRSHL